MRFLPCPSPLASVSWLSRCYPHATQPALIGNSIDSKRWTWNLKVLQWKSSQRTIFQYLWPPKSGPSLSHPAGKTDSGSKNDVGGDNGQDISKSQNFYSHKDLYNKDTLWGAKTGVGSRMPFPPQAEDSLLERLEKAHMCTERLLQRKSQLLHTKSTVTFPSSSPREAPSKRLGSCPVLEDLLDEHWTFRLERQPSTLPGAGMGLFLVQGRVHAGEVITCHPGLVYRIPYDLEACMPMDEVSFSPCPPPFLVKNDYLLRFYHPVTNQHLLLDGCPQGISALNFIAANQRRGHPWANMEWLESSPFGSRRRGPERGEGLLEGGWGEGRKDRGMPGGPMQGTSCLGEGGEEVLLPREMDSSKYFTAKLGLGHLAHAPRGRHSERGAEGPQDGQTRSWDAGRSCQHDEGGEGGGLKFNDPHSPEKYNAEFHLCELPSDLPPHLLRFIPNLHFAQGIGSRRFCVLVTASKNLEVPQGAPPVEIYVPYASSFTEVCKHGFPLL